MVDIPIDSCCVVLTDSGIRNMDTTNKKCKTKSSDNNSYSWYIIVIGTIAVLLLFLFLIISDFTFDSEARNTSTRIQPEMRAEWIRLDSPVDKDSLLKWMEKVIDEEPSLHDQTEFVTQTTRVAEDDAFSTISEEDADTRSKRETYRKRRDCDSMTEHCKTLLQTMQYYLQNFTNTNLTINGKRIVYSDLLKCLQCKKLTNTPNETDENYTPRLKDQYFSHNYAEQNRSSDYGGTVIKLLDDGQVENNSKRTEVNQTEIEMMVTDSIINDPSRNVTNQLSKDISVSKATTVSIDHINSNESQQIRVNNIDNSSIHDKLLDINSTANASQNVEVQNNGGVPVTSKIDQQHRTIIESEDVASTKSWLTTELIRTRYSAITDEDEQFRKTTIAADSIGTTSTRIIDLTKNTKNVTSMPTEDDVTGINNDVVQPSTRPSIEGQPENQSTMKTNVSTDNRRDYELTTSADQLQVKDNDKSIPEDTKASQQFEQTPMMWRMQPVCFFSPYPSQSSNKSAFYPDPSSAQNRGFPFQNPFNRISSSLNHKVPENIMQDPPNYADSRSTGQNFNPTEFFMSNAPISSLNQQPIAQQPIANTPYFCTYMSVYSPLIPGTSQSDRSADEAKAPPEESKKLPREYDDIVKNNLKNSRNNICPTNHLQCHNQQCIPRVKWCDGHVDCTDASDEIKCTCTDRIPRNRLCDGYFDCPHGEDEVGCFGCPKGTFNCYELGSKWQGRNSNNCVHLSKRCNGQTECPNGKDELECSILVPESIGINDIFPIGYSEGYLYKNVQGEWFPVCSRTFLWAMQACALEAVQPLEAIPKVEIVNLPTNASRGIYVAENKNNIYFTTCHGSGIYVKCPPSLCGTKISLQQNLSPVSNAWRNNYMYRRREGQSAFEFNKVYQETLGLLNISPSKSEEKVKDQNDTIVGSQLRVVGGRASQPKAWPFLVAIYKNGLFYCGGVIISKKYILTAAHCMDGYIWHYYEVQAGTLRRSSFSPMTQWRKVEYVFIHPGFNREEMLNDIAVIILDRPLYFNRWVHEACILDLMGSYWIHPSPQSVCVAIGWGALTEDGTDSDNLREVEVPILPSCKYTPELNEAMICAGYPEGGRDACQGDSGGPLMCKDPYSKIAISQWYVAGLISHGDGCGRPNEPGVYVRVNYYMPWVKSIIKISDLTFFLKNMPLDSCPGFTCLSGRCLSETYQCNGIVNCLDAEDERGCKSIRTSGNYRESNSNYTSVKPQENEMLRDIIEKNNKLGASTESVPISTTSFSFYQTEMQTDSNTDLNNTDTYVSSPKMSTSEIRFTCKSLIQTITINKKCDKHLDCEDGTDEKDCTCRDYLLNIQPTAICDGHLDCDDETDEKDCGICKDDEFHCNRSEGCISIAKKCDENYDCPLGEDEVDCLTLTNGKYINMDSENRPILNIEGLFSRYSKSSWRVECLYADLENSTVISTIGRNLCKYIGFTNVQSWNKIAVNRTVLETRLSRRWDNTTDYEPSLEHDEEDKTCTALWFRCKPVLSSSADSHLIVDSKTGNYIHLWPWLAAIFVDGRYHCSGLLLESDWVLCSSSCTEAIRLSVNYTTALFGRSRLFLYVDGPHQQVSVVDEIRNVEGTDVSLLHLKSAINFTRYVQPLFTEKKIYPPAKNDICVAVSTDKENLTRSIFLQPVVENCNKCYRCFVQTSDTECLANQTSDWSGTVFCRSQEGWYPAAVFHGKDGPCSFQIMQNLTSIDYIHAYLTQALEKKPQIIPEAACNGIRCNIGQCIPWDQVCDGVEDCRDGADEENKLCLQMQQKKERSAFNYNCAKSELRCENGKCISKSAFCDSKVDCSDGTDEPVICSCAEYLKLTKPERLCDGVRHCLDKTDESPEMCQCTETKFKCNTENENVTCIPQDFICDGEDDCPNGEDEKECRKIRDIAGNRTDVGEVIERSYGVWHILCYPSVSSQEEARNVCRQNGYKDGIIDHEYQVFDEPVVPSRDDFYMIRLNLETWITMRDDKPLITLVRPEKPCYRLFVKCNS